jgi:hypothetical protein
MRRIDMLEKEKVMEGLKCCNTNNCGACPYAEVKRCLHVLHEDAFTLLRAVEIKSLGPEVDEIAKQVDKI